MENLPGNIIPPGISKARRFGATFIIIGAEVRKPAKNLVNVKRMIENSNWINGTFSGCGYHQPYFNVGSTLRQYK